MYKNGNEHTAIHFFSHVFCKNANAINELGFIAEPKEQTFST